MSRKHGLNCLVRPASFAEEVIEETLLASRSRARTRDWTACGHCGSFVETVVTLPTGDVTLRQPHSAGCVLSTNDAS